MAEVKEYGQQSREAQSLNDQKQEEIIDLESNKPNMKDISNTVDIKPIDSDI